MTIARLSGRIAHTLLLMGLAVFLLHAGARIPLEGVAEPLGTVGPALALVPLPYLAAAALDSFAWRSLLGPVGRKLPLARLLKVRLASESVGAVLPSAGVATESASLYLLSTRHGVPLPEAVASLAGRKLLVVGAHGCAILLGSLLWLDPPSGLNLPDPRLAAALGGGVVLAVWTLGRWIRRGDFERRLGSLLGRVPFARWRARLERKVGPLAAAGRRLASDAGSLRWPRPLFLGVLLLEAFETWLLLWLLGADIGLREVLGFEAFLSCLRALAFFVPSGVGVQDLGYLLVLQGLDPATGLMLGGSFVVLKRAKELLWISVGGVLLAKAGGGRTPECSAALEGARP